MILLFPPCKYIAAGIVPFPGFSYKGHSHRARVTPKSNLRKEAVMFKKFPPENPSGPMLEEITQPRRPEEEAAENKGVHPPRINQIIQSLNLQARYDLTGGEGSAGKPF
ncbi:MAG: hypothetical protein C4576_23395 [Desulfobacteraceae bacterium]|nr:MAG: hypothetical protein C4576_23395 [Desulfobacteraceae bacterium]